MTDHDRDTQPPPPPPNDWRQEILSALAEVQDRAGEMMHLLGRMYRQAAAFGGAITKLGEAIAKAPPNE